jgi:hypothetical protein
MDSTYMQMEKVRGVGSELPSPRSLEAPEQQSLEAMGYGDATQKCGDCAHFEAEQSMCSKAGEQCDPGGHCGSWEGGEDGEEMPEPEAETE